MAMSFSFILSNNTACFNGNSESDSDAGLLSNNGFQNVSVLTATSDYDGSCTDAFGGKDMFGTCDISNSNVGFVADASAETAGSVAFNSFDAMGSIACGSVETAGSVACASGCSDSGSSGGGSFSSFC